jgi:hypothetical protein
VHCLYNDMVVVLSLAPTCMHMRLLDVEMGGGSQTSATPSREHETSANFY